MISPTKYQNILGITFRPANADESIPRTFKVSAGILL